MNHLCTQEYNTLCSDCDDTDTCTEGSLDRRYEEESIEKLKIRLEKAENKLRYIKDECTALTNAKIIVEDYFEDK